MNSTEYINSLPTDLSQKLAIIQYNAANFWYMDNVTYTNQKAKNKFLRAVVDRLGI